MIAVRGRNWRGFHSRQSCAFDGLRAADRHRW